MSTDGGAGGFFRSVTGMTGDVRSLIRTELRSTQEDLASRVTARARRAGKGAAMVGGAGVLGAVATGTAAVLLVRVLDALLPSKVSAFVATVLFGGGAAALGAAGVAELRRSLAGADPTEAASAGAGPGAGAGPTSAGRGPW